jgi:N-acetylglucosamine malate deacetylase 2
MNSPLQDLITPDKIVRERIAIVVAHPDDEVIAAGGQLHRWPNVAFIHVTNGSPPALDDARNAGSATREEYAELRRAEFNRVLKHFKIPSTHALQLNFNDQETAFRLDELTNRLSSAIKSLAPDAVITHAYEGGHPDHDATCLAVHQLDFTPIFEFAGYHNASDWLVTGEFLPAFTDTVARDLTPAEQRQKEMLFSFYKSQRNTLALFKTDHESFRVAPHYDFTEAPHRGKLYYERFPWNMTAPLWSQLALQFMGRTGASPVPLVASTGEPSFA